MPNFISEDDIERAIELNPDIPEPAIEEALCFVCDRMREICKISALVMIVLSASYAHAAGTPDEVAKLLIQTIEESDLELYEGLIYPASLKQSKERGAERYEQQMALRFKRKKPSQYNSYEVTITDIVDDEDSNKAEKRLRYFKNKWAIFPVTPQKRLNIIVKEGDVKTEGEWTVPYSSQVLSEENGKWYMVYPGEFVEIE